MELEELAEPDWLPADPALPADETTDTLSAYYLEQGGAAAEWASDYPVWLDEAPHWVDACEL